MTAIIILSSSSEVHMKNHEEDTFVSDAKIGKQILPPTHTPQGGVGGSEIGTQGLVHAKHIFYHRAAHLA